MSNPVFNETQENIISVSSAELARRVPFKHKDLSSETLTTKHYDICMERSLQRPNTVARLAYLIVNIASYTCYARA